MIKTLEDALAKQGYDTLTPVQSEVSKKEFENSVLYTDLNDPSSLAKNLKELSENTKLRQELIEEGKKKISNLMSKKTFMNLFNLFEEYFKIQSRWK